MDPMQEKELNGSERGKSRRKGSRQISPSPAHTKKILITAACVALGLTVAGGAAYIYMGQQYRRIFFPGTTINGMDASRRSVEEIKQMIADGMDGYQLVLEERGDREEVIYGTSLNLHPEYDGSLERLLEEQNPLAWGFEAGREKAYTIDTMIAYDEEKLEAEVDQLACFDPENIVPPENAKLSEYIAGAGYQIIPADPGSTVRRDALLEQVKTAIGSLSDRLVLDEAGVYEEPEVGADDPALVARMEAWNRYANVTVTYRFGSSTEVLDGTQISQWLTDDGYGNPVLDETQVTEYVRQLAKTYNTAYQPKELKTSYGETVTIVGGPYGWRINQTAETAALMEILRSGQGQEREPVYSQTANSHDGPDYGDTYVEINLTAQHLFFYKEGKLVAESDFVSGNESRGWSTPDGAYPLTYKERNATLKGENYATPVSYWMPFNGNIGMHDADWRSSFGGNIYRTSGSHGCVNLPPSVAKTIYENITAGMPVLCYHLGGTQSTASSSATKETKPAETTAAQTQPDQPQTDQPQETQPQETGDGAQPGEAQPGETSGGTVTETPGTPGGTTETPVAGVPGGTTETPGGTDTSQQTTAAPSEIPGGTVTVPGGPGSSADTSNPGGGAASAPGDPAQEGISGGPGVQSGDQPSSGAVSGPGQ